MENLPFTYGIELEFNNVTLPSGLVDGINCTSVIDGVGKELRTKIMRTEDDLNNFLKKLTYYEDCLDAAPSGGASLRGMHVHVGVRSIKDFGAKWRILRALISLQTVLLKCENPDEARISQYAKPWNTAQINLIKARKAAWFPQDFIKNGVPVVRYSWVNIDSLYKHGTLEFRYFDSTKNASVVLGRLGLINIIMEATVNAKLKVNWDNEVLTVGEFEDTLKLMYSLVPKSRLTEAGMTYAESNYFSSGRLMNFSSVVVDSSAI